MISCISSSQVINVVMPDPNIFLRTVASVADLADVNPNGIKTDSTNGFNTFFINGNPVYSNGPKTLSENPPDCVILCN